MRKNLSLDAALYFAVQNKKKHGSTMLGCRWLIAWAEYGTISRPRQAVRADVVRGETTSLPPMDSCLPYI